MAYSTDKKDITVIRQAFFTKKASRLGLFDMGFESVRVARYQNDDKDPNCMNFNYIVGDYVEIIVLIKLNKNKTITLEARCSDTIWHSIDYTKNALMTYLATSCMLPAAVTWMRNHKIDTLLS